MLAVECDSSALDSLVRRIEDELSTMGIDAAVGAAPRPPDGSLDQAWLQADAAVTARSRAQATA